MVKERVCGGLDIFVQTPTMYELWGCDSNLPEPIAADGPKQCCCQVIIPGKC